MSRLAGGDGSVGAGRRGACAGGIEIGLHAGRPVFRAVASRRRAGPALSAHRIIIDLLKLLVERDVDALHTKLVLLLLPPVLEVGVDGAHTGDLMKRPGKAAHHHRLARQRVIREAEHVLFGEHQQLEPGREIEAADVIESRRILRFGEFRQVAQLPASTQNDESRSVGDQGFQDVVPIREQLPDRVVGSEQGVVADLI